MRRQQRYLGIRAVSLSETLIAVMIFASVSAMAAASVRFLGVFQREMATLNLDRDAQAQMYRLAKEIQNADSIDNIAFDSLQIKVYNVRRYGFDSSNASLFNTTLRGTVTYTYVQSGKDSWLNRQEVFPQPSGPPITTQTKLFKNMLTPPTNGDYIFNNLTYPSMTSVEIALRFSNGFFKSFPKVYKQQTTIRSYRP